MKRGINLIGRKFGRLLVLKEDGQWVSKNGRSRYIRWKCLCDCGNEHTTTSTLLLRGTTKSCGCLQKELARSKKLLPEGEAGFNAVYSDIQQRANKRKQAFSLTKEDAKLLFESPCHYCGAAPSMVKKAKGGAYIYNGIDRKNNNIGYTKENSLSCCGWCNSMKSDKSYQDFIDKINSIASNLDLFT